MLSGMNKRRFGQKIEAQAERYLQSQGLIPVERNAVCKVGEIDLIMRDRNQWVFVEVRYRKSKTYGSAAESINWQKIQSLQKAMLWYLQSKKLDNEPCRCDVVTVEPDQGKLHFEWIVDALGA